jgi:hypothetical protein
MLREIIKPHTDIITIQIPKEYVDHNVEVIVFPFDEIQKIVKSKKMKYDLSDLTGKLKWNGDSVEEQRKIRDEW